MISKNEIAIKSRNWGVPPDTVDKDYVLGHFLSVFCRYFADKRSSDVKRNSTGYSLQANT
jgi:hypothetical protein